MLRMLLSFIKHSLFFKSQYSYKKFYQILKHFQFFRLFRSIQPKPGPSNQPLERLPCNSSSNYLVSNRLRSPILYQIQLKQIHSPTTLGIIVWLRGWLISRRLLILIQTYQIQNKNPTIEVMNKHVLTEEYHAVVNQRSKLIARLSINKNLLALTIIRRLPLQFMMSLQYRTKVEKPKLILSSE